MSTLTLSTGAPRRIGFISTRFHGTDGVTLEARKWARILAEQGHSCFWMAGLLDTPPETSFHVPLAFFGQAEVVELQKHLFGGTVRSSAVNDFLRAAFPPDLPYIEHVVINSMAQKELARRCSLPSAIIPNVVDFEVPPPGMDDYNGDLRREIGLDENDLFILQPTRVVA